MVSSASSHPIECLNTPNKGHNNIASNAKYPPIMHVSRRTHMTILLISSIVSPWWRWAESNRRLKCYSTVSSTTIIYSFYIYSDGFGLSAFTLSIDSSQVLVPFFRSQYNMSNWSWMLG